MMLECNLELFFAKVNKSVGISLYTVYLLKIQQDKNNYCHVLPKQIGIKLQIYHGNAWVPNN